MKNKSNKAGKGISVRITHIAMLVLGVAIILLLVFSTYQSSSVFTKLNKATGNYITRQKAAHDLMEASDYLTEMVQRFTLDGDRQYMDNYFEEAFTNKRRENSITAMAENEAEQGLIDQIQAALNESNSLMFREYYAMKLVIEAKEYRDYPETLKGYDLKEEDQLKTPEEKMELAQQMVMGKEYYEHKEVIRNNLNASLLTLDKMMTATRQEMTAQLNRELATIRTFILILGILILVLIGLSAWQGTIPLIRAEKAARNHEPVPEIGAKEFRYLARSYNEMTGAAEKEKEQTPDPEE